MIRKYSELIRLKSFDARFQYLKLSGAVGYETFGVDRYLNQNIYTSLRWKSVRREVIVRDEGLDLATEGYPIGGIIIVHHMNPITLEQAMEMNDAIFDPEYLISTSKITHDNIHYGRSQSPSRLSINRKPGDTKLW